MPAPPIHAGYGLSTYGGRVYMGVGVPGSGEGSPLLVTKKRPLLTPEEQLRAPISDIVRYVDIFEEDGTTPWMLGAPTTDGSVSVDGNRDERRAIQISFDDTDNLFRHSPSHFWYDKIIKPRRGVKLADNTEFTWPLGEFLIDTIERDNFPDICQVVGRDYTKQLIEDEFQQSTLFQAGNSVESIIRTIATNGGIDKMLLANTGQLLAKDYTYDRQTSRWSAMKGIATAYGFDLFFDTNGYLVLREFRDPVTSPPVTKFGGGPDGALVSYKKTASSANIFNAVEVYGESTDANVIPVFAVAENHNPYSPTSIEELGRRRTWFYQSALVTTTDQAQAVADRFLSVQSLETYEVKFDAICFPFVDAMDVQTFEDPNPALFDPTSYLLTDFTIPLTLSPMSGTMRRVTVIQ